MSLQGAAPGDAFGASVAKAGDVNGDGYDDILVGAPSVRLGGLNTGAAYLYFGGPSPHDSPDLTIPGPWPGGQFGTSVTGAGDLNGDGFDDWIVGAPQAESCGRAYLFFGGTSPDATPDMVTGEGNPSDYFGFSVAGGEDVNGDGFPDFVVGAPFTRLIYPSQGRAYVFFGGPQMDGYAEYALPAANAMDFFALFGWSVSLAHDANGDGYSEVMVGARNGEASRGVAYAYFGAPTFDPSRHVMFLIGTGGSHLGTSVSELGDVNGDGLTDILVGAPDYDGVGVDTGRGQLMLGSVEGGLASSHGFFGDEPGAAFGAMVKGAGDVDSDGFDDMLVGAPLASVGGVACGRVWLYRGGNPPDATSSFSTFGSSASDRFGESLAALGDLDHNGHEDFAVGAPGTTSGRGAVYVLTEVLGSPTLGINAGRLSEQSIICQPNPTRSRSDITFNLRTEGTARLLVLDVSGRVVRELAGGWHGAGKHHVTWAGDSDTGAPVPAGLYFVTLDAGGQRQRARVVVTH